MITKKKVAAVTLGAAVMMPFAGTSTAFAASDSTTANLKPVALSGVTGSGTAMVTVDSGNTLTVTLAAMGLLKKSPHAAHIHFGADARHECPTAADDAGGDGHLNTTDGAPAYGPVAVSLTKTGDTSAKSVLAIDRFSDAPQGSISYERGSIKVNAEIAQAVAAGQGVVVVHGVDYNGNGKYDGDTKSDLDPKLPTEATDPALCGVLNAAPAGGAQTGGGGTATDDNRLALALGGGLLLVAVGAGAYTVRRARVQA